ncbi:MAG: carboxypeptidase regulatory-like domain-containing protein [Acidobacteria bacterium]|nr:carboxypeptidase regulatory-like domain-containing protein [Acidobacteriota bacterium]
MRLSLDNPFMFKTAPGFRARAGRLFLRLVLGVWLAAAALTAGAQPEKTDRPASADAVTAIRAFNNTTPVNIPSSGGAASAVTVSGMSGPVSRLTVTLNGVVHLTPADLDFLLVGPHGEQLVIFSDAGGAFGLSDSVIRLSDYNPALAPANASIGNGLVDYKPTNYGSFDTFTGIAGFPPEVGPGGFETLSSVFDGIDPNGVWTLFVQDDTAGGNGANSRLARGWSLTIETPETVQVTTFADRDDLACTPQNCSLRDAVKYSSNGSTIVFPASPGTITYILDSSLDVDKRLTISDFGTVGGGPRIFVSGNGQNRVFNVASTGDLTLNGIGVISGRSFSGGGGVLSNGSLTLNSCLLRDNRALNSHGGAIASFGNLKMTTTTVLSNEVTADFTPSQGGGIYLGKGPAATRDAEIFGSIIQSNVTTPTALTPRGILNGAGLAVGPQARAIVQNSWISFNSALDNGGGIYIDQGDLTLIDTSVISNSATFGRGTGIGSTPFAATRLNSFNSTVLSDRSSLRCLVDGAGASFTFLNTIVSSPNFPANCTIDTGVSAGHNIFGAVGSLTPQPTDIVTTDPRIDFASIRSGGFVPVLVPLWDSPAIDAGDPCVLSSPAAGGCAPVAITTDARLMPRSLGGGVDIGAAEFNFLPAGSLLPNHNRALPTAATGQSYRQQLSGFALQGSSSYTVRQFNVPGLTIGDSPTAPGTLEINGVPTTPGNYDIEIVFNNTAGFNTLILYTLTVVTPTAATVPAGGRVTDENGRGVAGAIVTVTGAAGQNLSVRTNSFGVYRFEQLAAGESYVFNVRSKGYGFAPQVVFLADERGDLDFTGVSIAGNRSGYQR